VSRAPLSLLVRALAIVLPVVLALSTSFGLSRLVPVPARGAGALTWWVASMLLSTAVLVVVDRQARRLVPLAVLLRLSLVFPDKAPSRLGAAMRVGTTRQLERRLRGGTSGEGRGETPSQAALRVLELCASLAAHDRATRGHSERVRGYARLIGREMGFSAAEVDRLNWAALLHDIGKLGVPAAVLNKRASLDRDEVELVHKHPEIGWDLIGPLKDWLGPWASAVREHHERWDGAGYPLGLRGEEISISARIVAVADAFDVMTSVRSYKRPRTTALARLELARCAGAHFDPTVVRAMLSISLGRMWPVMGPLTWLAQLPILGGTAPVAIPSAVSTAGRAMVLVGTVQVLGPVALGVPVPLAVAHASNHELAGASSHAKDAWSSVPGRAEVLPSRSGPPLSRLSPGEPEGAATAPGQSHQVAGHRAGPGYLGQGPDISRRSSGLGPSGPGAVPLPVLPTVGHGGAGIVTQPKTVLARLMANPGRGPEGHVLVPAGFHPTEARTTKARRVGPQSRPVAHKVAGRSGGVLNRSQPGSEPVRSGQRVGEPTAVWASSRAAGHKSEAKKGRTKLGRREPRTPAPSEMSRPLLGTTAPRPEGNTTPPTTAHPTTPRTTTPRTTTPRTTTPRATTVPSGPGPTTTTLARTTSETSTPQTSTPQTSTPQTSTPQTSTPQTSTPQTSTPQTGTPQTGTRQPATTGSPARGYGGGV